MITEILESIILGVIILPGSPSLYASLSLLSLCTSDPSACCFMKGHSQQPRQNPSVISGPQNSDNGRSESLEDHSWRDTGSTNSRPPSDGRGKAAAAACGEGMSHQGRE